jgi:hypothetical protein
LYQYDPGTNSTASVGVPGGKLQSVYAANDRVFVGRGDGAGPYSVVCYNESLVLAPPNGNIGGLLKGAAYGSNSYFIATSGAGGGIYQIDSSNTVKPIVTGQNVMGIICVVDYIIGITNNGTLYYFDHTSPIPTSVPSLSLGGMYTGAICSWKPVGAGSETLLLLGVRGSSMTHGYREVTLISTGKPDGGVRTPGDTPSNSTVQNKARYQAAIGKHAVYSIRQVPGSPVIFASTAKDGLWSLRNDQWNGEE